MGFNPLELLFVLFFYRSNSRACLSGPVARFARLIAGQGFIVAAPSVYHNFVCMLLCSCPRTDSLTNSFFFN